MAYFVFFRNIGTEGYFVFFRNIGTVAYFVFFRNIGTIAYFVFFRNISTVAYFLQEESPEFSDESYLFRFVIKIEIGNIERKSKREREI